MKKENVVDNIEGKETLALALSKLRKQYGNGVILQDSDAPKDIAVISTGCFAIDRLLGCGGLPRGRVIEIFGEPSEGKSTLCLFLAAQVQQAKGTVVYVDAENAYDAAYAKKLGVRTEDLLVSQPETLEEAFDTIRALSETNQIDLIVVDSVAALVPKSELEGKEMLKETMALQARLLGKALRIVTGPISRSKTIVIFINQTRDKVGIFWGNPSTTPGGKALKFFSSVRLKVSKGEKILGAKDVQIGNAVNITAVKNKVGMPFRKGSFDLYYGSGVDLISDTFDTAEELKITKKEGNTYVFKEEKLGVGREKAIDTLKNNIKLYEEIKKETRRAVEIERKG
jgi:recombination protein RecA